MLTPQKHQLEAIGPMASNIILADDCGLGKTLTAILAIRHYYKGLAPILILAPRNVKGWWADQLYEELPMIPIFVTEAAGRRLYIPDGPGFVITHPESLLYIGDELAKHTWEIVIVDEAHRFGNRKAKRTKALFKIKHTDRRWLLTATPYRKDPSDMWSLLHYIDRTRWSSYWSFYNRHVDYVELHVGGGRVVKSTIGPKNLQKLAQEVQGHYLRREKEGLPPLEFFDVPVQMNNDQAKLYTTLKRDMWVELDEGSELLAPNKLALMTRLQQIALHPALVGETSLSSAKLDWLLEWLNENPDEPVVIASKYRKFIEGVQRCLGNTSVAVVVGGMSEKAVKEQLDLFNSDKCHIIIGTLSAALAEGHNLQKAATIIITDGHYDPALEYQMSNRIHRIGQTRPCQVIHLVATYMKGDNRRPTVDQLCRAAVRDRLTQAQVLSDFVNLLRGD